MPGTKGRDKEASPALPAGQSLLSVIRGLVDLWSSSSSSVASLLNTLAASSRSAVDWANTASLFSSTLTRWRLVNSGWRLTATTSLLEFKPLLAHLRPSTAGLRHPKRGLGGLFLTWWIWRSDIAWTLTQAMLLLSLLYFVRWGAETQLLELKHAAILILGTSVTIFTVVKSFVPLGFLGWLTYCGALACVYINFSHAPSCLKTRTTKL